MPYRTESFDEFLSEQLQEPGMAKEFLLSSLEEEGGDNLVGAIVKTIGLMGIKEFSKMSGIHRNTVSRMMAKNEIPKIETLNKYLLAFDLKAKISVEPKDAD